MKIVVIGGSGLIGSNVVNRLRHNGHETMAASRGTGVDTITGQGLAAALAGAEVVVDVANSPSFEDTAVMEFFRTSGRNLLGAERGAGVKHHIALSVVGAERLPQSGYFRAKLAQEDLLKSSGVPYTILRSAQFFEFIESILASATDENTVRLSPALVQPVAADDVAAALADLAIAAPLNGTLEIAGLDRIPLDELARKFLVAHASEHQVIADIHARYFGSELNDRSLVANSDARIGVTRFQNWLNRATAPHANRPAAASQQ